MADIALEKEVAATIDRALHRGDLSVIERRNGSVVVSQQDQYRKDNDGGSTALSFQSLLQYADLEPPDYTADSRKRDAWLLEFVRKDPHLAGVVSNAVSLVANRGWSLTGGRNVVNRVRNLLHDADRDEGARRGRGWRHFVGKQANAFYSCDIGTITELGRLGDGRVASGSTAPLRAMWSVDPTLFQLTGNTQEPLLYHGGREVDSWKSDDYFRIANNYSLESAYLDLGYSAVSICIEIAKILIAVYRYEQERLNARAPRGLLLLKGIRERSWNNAMKARGVQLDGYEQRYYGGVAVLASMSDLDAKLVALSELPDGFDRETVLTHAMYLYALAFGFFPDEFWPVQTGRILGRNTEAQVGRERATQKGDADFFVSFQESLQNELPAAGSTDPIVLFLFDERGSAGRKLDAEIAQTWASVASTLYTAGLQQEKPLLERDQALSLLVKAGVLPPEITSQTEEDAVAFDTGVVRMKDLRDRARSDPGLWRAAKMFPRDTVVRYNWPSNKVVTLFENGLELTKPVIY